MDMPTPVVWDTSPFVTKTLRRIFDDDAVDTLSYMIGFMTVWVVLYLAMSYLVDHANFFKTKIYEFPIDPAREPLPKQEVVNE